MRAGFIYSGQYRGTYSVLLAAQTSVEARRLFVDWLENKGEAVSIPHVIVRRTYKGDKRPVLLT